MPCCCLMPSASAAGTPTKKIEAQLTGLGNKLMLTGASLYYRTSFSRDAKKENPGFGSSLSDCYFLNCLERRATSLAKAVLPL
jgi:hypothetical protein